jgi:hypothetical protein
MRALASYSMHSPGDKDTDIRNWVPLEEILEAYLQMIREARVELSSDSSDDEHDEDQPAEDSSEDEDMPDIPENLSDDETWPGTGFSIQDNEDELGEFSTGSWPWYVRRNFMWSLPATLKAWNLLIRAIETRLPRKSERSVLERYTKANLVRAGFKDAFAIKFLHRLPMPSFEYVAPGLRIPSPSEMEAQPFPNNDEKILFLRAEGSAPESTPGGISERNSGLYMTTSGKIYDGCELWLPYPICQNGHAKFGDMQTILSKGYFWKYSGLYQPGYNHLAPGYRLRLENLFNNWRGMVEAGYWEVGENGVTGGIDKFKEADTEDKWPLYFIKRTW